MENLTLEKKHKALSGIGLVIDISDAEKINGRYDEIIKVHGSIEAFVDQANSETKGMDAWPIDD